MQLADGHELGELRLMAHIVQDRLEGPQILYVARSARLISDLDLRGLIPDTWLYVDWPERIIGTANWVLMFRAAGFLTIPYGLPSCRPADCLPRCQCRTNGRNVLD